MARRWHIDYHSPSLGLTFEISRSLYQEQSRYQKIEIVQNPDFGRIMLLDGVLMLTASEEFVYHEMLSQPSLFTHPRPERVLIIGGGDCGTLKRVLMHPWVQSVVQVEIDEMVTRVSRQFFPELTSAAQDPRTELVFADGIAYMKEHQSEFDLILVDSTDPAGAAEGLFQRGFYQDCQQALKEDGILCIQSESPWIKALQPVIRSAHLALKELFPFVFPYQAAIQTYQAGLWLFQLASKKHSPHDPDCLKRISAFGNKFRYYNPEIHPACFALPEFVKELLS